MVALHDKTKTTLRAIESLSEIQEHRPYLGMSMIGHSCTRYLWYTFRWCYHEELSSRLLRLFERGHREEPAIIETLKRVGIHCYGDQTEVTTGHGHIKGHCDGIAIGVIEAPKTEHLLEFKTMNDKSFKDVTKKGVKESKPLYYAQMQIYKKHLNLTRGLFIAVNKNDDTMYIERTYYNEDEADTLERRAETVILSEDPLKKIGESTWYECKWCSARDICHGGKEVDINCRTCQYCDLCPLGKWECSKHSMILATEQQRIGCNEYKKLECL